VRVRGKVEMVEDIKLKRRLSPSGLSTVKCLKKTISNGGFPPQGKATTWTMQDGDAPAGFIDL